MPRSASSEEASPSPGADDAGRKSRSKRRRERRKAAKASGSDSQARSDESAAKQPKVERSTSRYGSKKRAQDPGSPSDAASRRPGPGRSSGAQGGSRPQNRYSPTQSSGRRDQQLRSHRAPAKGERVHKPIDGLPPLSPEDLAAVASRDRDNRRPPRYDANQSRGGSRSRPQPASQAAAVHRLETLSPSKESIFALAALQGVLDEAVPLSPKHRAELRGDIRRLWEELTSDRESRTQEYLGTPAALSAYLRYFLPWNVYRLSSILSNADFCLPFNAVIADIGSGPLTLPIALWIARPELRDVPLTIYCVDRVERVLEAGRNIFQTLCMRVDGRLPPWRIEVRKESFGAALPERAHLLTAANVFNEFFWRDKQKNLGEKALETARTLLSYLKENGSIFLMEPGDPRSGAFITSLRAALLAEGAGPLGPCPHALSCPMPGIFRHLLPPEETRFVKNDPNAAPSRFVLPPVNMPKKRDKFPWCHFGIDALEAPSWLEKLSEEAGLPKERAVLSYLWAARGVTSRPPVGMPESTAPAEHDHGKAKSGRGMLVRIVSDPFSLSDGSTGQYACSCLGYTLVKRQRGTGNFASGDLLEISGQGSGQRSDEKSGAIILST